MDVPIDRPWFIQGVQVPIDPPVGEEPQLHLDQMLHQDEIDMYERRYGSIRSYFKESRLGRVSLYNLRIPVNGSIEAVSGYLRTVFDRQATSFKFNAAVGAILKHKTSGLIRYFHPSQNNYRLLEENISVQHWDDLSQFIDMTGNLEWTEHAAMQMPNSSWKVIMVTNITMYVFHMNPHPIGGKSFLLDECEEDGNSGDEYDSENDVFGDDDDDDESSQPPPCKRSKQVSGVTTVPMNNENMCVFYCIQMHKECNQNGYREPPKSVYLKRRGKEVKELFTKWWSAVSPGKHCNNFQGVFMDDLEKVETYFDLGINVYTRSDEGNSGQSDKANAILVRRPPNKHKEVINVHLSGATHFDFIWSMDSYASSFTCKNCGQLWKRRYNCERHENSCVRASRYRYVGGPYSTRKSFYDHLAEVGIWVEPQDRFYEYRATYDLESCLVPIQNQKGYTSRHVPMSVSIASNVPGFEGPFCIVSDGDAQKMVNGMITQLLIISDEAYQLTSTRMEKYIDKLDDLKKRHALEVTDPDPTASCHRNTPIQRAENKFKTWMRAMPVVSFNGSRYDLQLIKPHIAQIYSVTDPVHAMKADTSPSALEDRTVPELGDCLSYMIKKGNAITCLSTKKLTFLDVCNYIPPGYNYAKYLETYGNGQVGTKSWFPYEYVVSLDKLNEPQIPPYQSFYSSLKQTNTLEEGLGEQQGRQNYAELQRIWDEHDMKTLKDLLIFYNNSDTYPFLKALNRQASLYREYDLDMLKDAPSLPGLSLKYGMKGLNGAFHTFDESKADLCHLLYDSLVGGPSLVFCRYAEVGVTGIRTPDYGDAALTCQSIYGFDANMLYPWGMAQEMPIGPCIVRKEPLYRATETRNWKGYSNVSMEWLNYEAHVRGDINIQHKGNGPEVKIGSKHIPVDGYHAESETIFQFHGCMFHGHTCQDPKDPDASWLGLTLQQRRDRTERVHEYLQRGCGYHVVTMWECRWKYMKQSDPAIREFIKANLSETDINSDEPIPDPGSDMKSILQAIQDDKLFGMALVDLHTPEVLKHKFRDLPPIFKRAEVGRADIGEHMKKYCEESGLLPSPRPMLISSYFAVNTLIATPLLKWYIDMGLIVTRVYMVMQYRRSRCFLRVTENAAEKRRIADLDSSQKLAGESTKLLANSIYGKTCERKSRFKEVKFVSGAAASAAVCSKRFHDMTKLEAYGELPMPSDAKDRTIDPDSLTSLQDMCHVDEESERSDVYELSMAPRKINMDLPIQIAFFVYSYAKMCMLQFRFEMMEEYMEHNKWCPLYMDTDSYYVSLAGEELHDVIKHEKKREFYTHYPLWFPTLACDRHSDEFINTATQLSPAAWYPLRKCCMDAHTYNLRTPGLFKTEFSNGKSMVSLCSKTYFCSHDTENKFSCKGLQKRNNTDVLNHSTYYEVLTKHKPAGGVNRGMKSTKQGHVYTYEQPRMSLSYMYAKRRVLDDGVHTEPLNLWSLRTTEIGECEWFMASVCH